jgi:DNA-directed RNA polymerase subunit RPC12/RpoP
MRCAHGKGDGMKRGRECVFRRELELETLVCTRGRDFPLSLLAERLRCPTCGSRRVAVIYDPPSGMSRIQAAQPA